MAAEAGPRVGRGPRVREAWYLALAVADLLAWCFAPHEIAKVFVIGFSALLLLVMGYRTISPLGSRRQLLGITTGLVAVSVGAQFYVGRTDEDRLKRLVAGASCADIQRILHGRRALGRVWRVLAPQPRAVSDARGPLQSVDLLLVGQAGTYYFEAHAMDSIPVGAEFNCPHAEDPQ